jgi:hypothetical protein
MLLFSYTDYIRMLSNMTLINQKQSKVSASKQLTCIVNSNFFLLSTKDSINSLSFHFVLSIFICSKKTTSNKIMKHSLSFVLVHLIFFKSVDLNNSEMVLNIDPMILIEHDLLFVNK